jgi:hypothetical protein
MDRTYGLGILEQLQPGWLIDLSVGLRFTLVTLAAIAVFTGVRETWHHYFRGNGKLKYFTPQTYALFFVNRVLIAAGILCYAPAAAYRLGVRGFFEEHHVGVYATMVFGHLLFITYFLISETLRLTFTGEYTLRRAIKQSWFFVIAALVLGAFGIFTYES